MMTQEDYVRLTAVAGLGREERVTDERWVSRIRELLRHREKALGTRS